MRTTLTIDDDLMKQLKEQALHKGLSLKQLVNQTLRAGLEGMRAKRPRKPYKCPSFAMGPPVSPVINLDKALALASDLEDEEVLRKLSLRK